MNQWLLVSHLHRQLVMLRLQQLVAEPRDRRRLQDVVQGRDVLVVGHHQDFQHVDFADVTADVERKQNVKGNGGRFNGKQTTCVVFREAVLRAQRGGISSGAN